MFTEKIDPIMSNELVTIGENNLHPKVIVTVSWSCDDEEGKPHINKLKLYSTLNTHH